MSHPQQQSTDVTNSPGGAGSAPAAPAPPGERAHPAQPSAGRGSTVGIALALAVFSFLLYIPSLSAPFVDYDDPQYVTRNAMVQMGLTAQSVKWAVTTSTFGNWLPVTWLSHLLDVQLFGLNAGGHHATSAALHGLNATLVFLALQSMTGFRWRSAAVAAFFAVHPLRVESVTWIAERKDVLCATFFLLALLAYAAYSRRPSPWRFGVVLGMHALGLMSKTMLVTLPCVLLLLDFWPLRRFACCAPAEDTVGEGARGDAPAGRSVGWLLLEKLPLFGLSAVSSVWTLTLQSEVGAMWGGRDFTLWQRVANAVVSIPRYFALTAWPTNLSIFYPHPGHWPIATVAAAGVLVAALTVASVVLIRRRSYLAVGWFWFLGMLVPVIGLVQVGLQSIADRYTYIPGIGLLVMAVWGMADLLRARPQFRRPAVALGLAGLVALSVGTIRQQRHWQSTYDLFSHALSVDQNNWLAHSMVGMVCDAAGEDEAALGHYKLAIELNPNHPDAYHNYGRKLHRLGRLDEAMELYRKGLQIQPDHPMTHFNLGIALAARKQYDAAASELELASRYDPRNAMVRVAWGAALMSQGKGGDATARFNEALEIDPNNAFARNLLQQATAPQAAQPPATAPVAITE
jgi:Tfp pilus assembly protein PilF